MIYDLQKASMWKRISAFLFDFILLGIVAVLFGWALSGALGYNGVQKRLDEAYARYGQEYGIDLKMSLREYEALDDEGRATMEAAYAALGSDPQAKRDYNLVIQLSILIVSFGLLLGFLTMEFFIPLRLKNGMTLGKRIFGLGVMRTDGVRVSAVSMFIRTVLGKFAIEAMIPAIILMMIFWGVIGVVGPAVLLGIVGVEAVLLIATRNNSLIHDLLADTVVVDYASQMIFDSREDMIRYKEKLHAEQAAGQEY